MKMTDLLSEAYLSELSKGTLSNYSDKADMDIVKAHRVRGPQHQAGDKGAVAKTDKRIDKRMKGIDRASDRLNKEVDEGHYRRPGSPTAYDRDYASSVSGMGHKQSQAYQQDGGANDEGWDKEEWKPREESMRLTAIYFYNVPAGQEDQARAAGLTLTKNGKWGLKQYNKSGRTFAHQSNVASQTFGKPRIWHPTNESATAGSTSAANVAVGAVYPNKPAKAAKNKNGTVKNAIDMNANLLTGGSIKR